ncbi:MAG: type II toxin-antitoxin system VapC family toxin [Leptolyngbyaceae cyanobacterium SU_3_3]|nr:type II toxin-antitoxin system VapC family toxin [Leptolyngbyaceae cyanobacterium SU_3_3]NJR51952.1 type II toxin-antitoxin system VapC family toxin [Leptolyngbyaceae cyanobacterium CSU_1_3]
MIRTYLDSGVLIIAARGVGEASERAIEVLEDGDRGFVSSLFLKIEILPKPIYHRQTDEVEFYEDFFSVVVDWVRDCEAIVEEAYQIACTYGLAAMDALHIASALALNADHLITTEKPSKPMHRVPLLQIVSIHPNVQH